MITVLGGFLLLFGLTSFLVRGKLFLSTAVIAIVFGTLSCGWTDREYHADGSGIILGPQVLK